jgi:hypothetical protein
LICQKPPALLHVSPTRFILVALVKTHPCVIIVDVVGTLVVTWKFAYPELANTIGTETDNGPAIALLGPVGPVYPVHPVWPLGPWNPCTP